MNQLHRLNSRAWIALLLAGILALFCAGLPVYADADSGSVTVTLCDSGSKLPISGASITIYQVADRRIQGYSVVYDFTEPFAASRRIAVAAERAGTAGAAGVLCRFARCLGRLPRDR